MNFFKVCFFLISVFFNYKAAPVTGISTGACPAAWCWAAPVQWHRFADFKDEADKKSRVFLIKKNNQKRLGRGEGKISALGTAKLLSSY